MDIGINKCKMTMNRIIGFKFKKAKLLRLYHISYISDIACNLYTLYTSQIWKS